MNVLPTTHTDEAVGLVIGGSTMARFSSSFVERPTSVRDDAYDESVERKHRAYVNNIVLEVSSRWAWYKVVKRKGRVEDDKRGHVHPHLQAAE